MKRVRGNAPELTGQPSKDSDSQDWRVFCAVDIPEKITELLSNRIQALERQAPNAAASWGRAGKFHLTLKFLEHISQNRLVDLSEAARKATESIKPFEITIGGAGTFPKHGPPRVLWIGVEDPTGLLQRLQKRLEEECSVIGFPAEERKFQPHLTLARLRKTEGARELARAHLALPFPQMDAPIKELKVYRSELGREGSKYSVISTHPFSE